MANNHYEEELLAAMKAIADASVATVKFDKTEKATIVDTSKSELGEYRVDNGAMTFTAYSDNKTYIDGDVVYVTIPGGDINQQKIISGKYVSGELEDTSYISPSETFISVTDNLFANQFDNEYALTANGATRMIPIASALIDEVGYNRILISGEFQTWLKHYNLAAGHYGLRIDIEEKKQIDPNRFDSQIHSYYLDVSSMYGDVYNFETFYKQEILCDTSNIEGLITKVSLVFYQLNDFIDAEKKEIEALVGADNIFVRNIDVRFGFDLANYDGEDVLLYTTKSSTYVDQITPTVKEYFKDKLDPDGPALSDADISGLLEEFNSKDFRIRWLIDEGDRKKVISNISEAPIGTSVHVYRWNLSEGVADFRAGNFWEEILDYKDSFDIKGFKPDSSKREEKIKIIIESPSQEYVEAQMNKDSEFIELSELANKDKTDGELLAKLEAKRNEYISQITRYISNELVFTNESDVVDYTSLDLITGLTIDVDVNGYNGVYMVYDDVGNILAASEGTKSRILSANYTSLVSGDDVADAAEKITWVIPLHNTMIRTPEYGKEYVGPKLIVDTQQLIDNPGTDEVKEYSDRIEITRVGVTPTVGMGEYEPGSAQQIFRIADHYRQTATNNTILCKIVKNRRTYTAAATLSFGPHGIQGTDYSFTLDYENGAIAIPRTKDYIAYIKPHIYNADNFEITDLYTGDAFEWSWYNKRENQNAAVDGLDILNNRPGYGGPKNVAAIRVNTDDVTKLRNYILVCKLKGYTPLASKDGNQQLTLVAYLPIAIKRPDLPNLAIDGAINVKYDTTGGNPKKYDKPYTLQSNETLIDDHGNPYQIDFEREDFITWRMVYDPDNCPDAETTSYSYYPHVSEKGYLILPIPFMTTGVGTQYSVEAVVKETRSFKNYKTVVKNNTTVVEYDTVTYTKDEVLWIQPIRLFIERYGSALLNAWDGNLTIDEENGIILSAMMGAGVKNTDNSFSGVLMGDVSKAYNQNVQGPLARYYKGIGLYGFDGGVQSFGLNVNGKAFFGASGHGQILIDGSSGEITSANYKINDCGINLDLDDGILTAKGPVVTTGTKETQSLLLIDPQAGGDYDSRPFFKISDHLGHDLMQVGYGVYKLQNSLYDEGKVGMQLDFNRGTLKAKSEAGKDDQGHKYKSSFVMIDGSGDSGSFFRIYDGKAQKDIFYAGGSQLNNAEGTRRITDSDTITVKTNPEVQKVMNENISNPVRAAKDPKVTTTVKPNKVEGDLAYITIIKTSRAQDDYTGGSVKYPVTTGDQAGKLESITSSECKICKWKTSTTTYTITIDMKKIKSIDLGEGAILDFRKPFCRDQVRDLKDKTVYGQEVVDKNPDKIIALTNRDGLTNTSKTVDSDTNLTIRHIYYKKTAVADIKNGTFFLQSSNYGGSENEEVNRLGMKIDLSEGSIAIYDKNATGGYVKLSSKASEFLKVVCVKDGNNQTLITAGESQFYLKSFDYKAPTIKDETVTDENGTTHTDRKITSPGKGLKIDLRSNTIEGYNVLIHTMNGADTDKYIKIDSSASTYPLRIGAKFRVSWEGSIWAKDGYFVDGHFSGVLESNEGHIGGFLITNQGIFTTTDKTTANGNLSLYSTGDINAGSNAIRISGSGKYMLIGTGAQIQFNGATGNAAFAGGLAIGGNMLVAGSISDADLTAPDANGLTFATAKTDPAWYINKENGVVVNKGKIGGWSITKGHIKSAGSKIDLSSASGSEYLKVGSLVLSSSTLNFNANNLNAEGTTDDKIFYSDGVIHIQSGGEVQLQGYAAHAGAYYKFPMNGDVSFNAISSFRLSYGGQGGTTITIDSNDAAVLGKIFSTLTVDDIAALKTFLNNISGKTWGSITANKTTVNSDTTGNTSETSGTGRHKHTYSKTSVSAGTAYTIYGWK